MATRASTRRGKPRAAKPRSQNGKTEEDLLQVATVMFRERGFNGTSVAEIAEAAGVTNAGLYYYFDTKQDLLLRVLRSGMNGFLSHLEKIFEMSASPREKLALAIDNHLRFVLGHGDAVAVFVRERRFLDTELLEDYQRDVDRYDELFRAIIAEGVGEGDLPDVDVAVTSMLVLGAINSIIEWRKPGGRLNEEELATIVRNLILDRMLRTD